MDIVGTNIPIDFMAFVDITYLQCAAAFKMINGGRSKKATTTLGVTTTTELDSNATLRYLSFAGFGKYPFQLGPITLFPLIDVEYDMTNVGTDSNGHSLNAFGL